jgi:hypothetical protein
MIQMVYRAPIKETMLDNIAALNNEHYERVHDEEIQSRIAQYEMAYRMQMSVPEVMDINKEPESDHKNVWS